MLSRTAVVWIVVSATTSNVRGQAKAPVDNGPAAPSTPTNQPPASAATLPPKKVENSVKPAANLPGAAASVSPATNAPASSLESKPPVYFLPDKNGELQPIVGFTLEEFEALLKLRDGAAAVRQRPDYRFESIEAKGNADARHARLEVKFTIAVDAPGWVRIPLDLRSSVLEDQAVYRGPGQFALQFDADRREYVLWLQGADEQPHELTLRTVTALEQAGRQKRLRLYLPRALGSTLSLSVAEAQAVAQGSLGSVLEGVDVEGKGSRIRVAGIGGDFQLAWGGAETAVERRQVLLEAKADVKATVDGRNIEYEAELTVNSFGGEFDGFTLRLPPSSVLIEEAVPELTVTKQTPAGNASAEVYEIRRRSGSAKSLNVRVRALRSLEKSRGGQNVFDFGMFEVVEAVRQSGYLAVEIDGDWQLLWGDRSRVRQVDAKPDFLRGRVPYALFEYYGRPFLLDARIVPYETRLSLDPAYEIDFRPGRADLKAKLKYRVGGAKIESLLVDMVDWQVLEVGPNSIVESEGLALAQSRPLTIPLKQGSTGEFEITVAACREFDGSQHDVDRLLRQLISPFDSLALGRRGTTAVALSLPRPVAPTIAPATLTVSAADGVELSPRDSQHVGLSRRRQAAAGVRDAGVWSYSVDAAEASFSAEIRPLRRSVQVLASTDLMPTRTGGEARQRFQYVVSHEPIDALEFDVPAHVVDKGRLVLAVGGKRVPWVVVQEDADGAGGATRIRASLPGAMLNRFDVEASFALREQQAISQASHELKIPLLKPLDGELVEHEMRIAAADGLTVQRFDDAWVPAANSDGASAAGKDTLLRGIAAPTEFVLGVRWDDPRPDDDIFVERLWVQTLMTATSRQERAVYQFATRSARANLKLPEGAVGIVVLLNGKQADVGEPTASRTASVKLPPDSADRPFVLDIRYRLDRRAATFDVVGLPPALENVKSVRQVFRQLVLPSDVCLLSVSEGYVAEYAWAWSGPALVRKPLLSQADLETWCGAEHVEPLPGRVNAYVLSGFGGVPELRVTLVKRTFLVLSASGLVLSYCLGLLYFQALRHPALIVVSAVATATLGALFPDIAPIILQAAAVGAILSLTALLLDRNVSRRRRRSATLPGESSLNLPRGSTKTRISQAIATPASTAGVEIPASAPSGSGGVA